MSLLYLASVESTMDTAREMLQSKDAEELLRDYSGVAAFEQKAGRGQRGREWYARPGEGFCATFFFQEYPFDLLLSPPAALLAGVAAAEAVQRACLLAPEIPFHSMDVGLKWPNDLLLNGRKLGGILIERLDLPAIGEIALIGVGINLRIQHFPLELAEKAASLILEGITDISMEQMGAFVEESLNYWVERLRGAGFPAIISRWRELDRSVGRKYRAPTTGGLVTGLAEGVSDEGELLLRMENGNIIRCISAESIS